MSGKGDGSVRNKKFVITASVIVVIIVAGILSFNFFYDYQAKKIASKTETYLITQENKKKEDFKEVKGIRSKVGDYGILVFNSSTVRGLLF